MKTEHTEQKPIIDDAIEVIAEAINLGWTLNTLHEIYVLKNGILSECEFYHAFKAAEILKETLRATENKGQ